MSLKFHKSFLFIAANPCHCQKYREKFQGYTDDIAKYSHGSKHDGGEYKYVFGDKFLIVI